MTIKTWQERVDTICFSADAVVPFMREEIAELRAALEAEKNRHLSDEDIHDIMSKTVDCSYAQGLAFARAIIAALEPK
jgi:hypothetical protein